MGSWTELDATYPPGVLTPAAAFIVALGHLGGSTTIYAGPGGDRLASFIPRGERGLSLTADVLARAERYLREVPLDAFLAEAGERLSPQQLRCLLLNLRLVARNAAPGSGAAERFGTLADGLGATPELLQEDAWGIVTRDDLSIFPQ